jgi:hypothetical protein
VDQSAKAAAMVQAPALLINIQFAGKPPSFAPTIEAKAIDA